MHRHSFDTELHDRAVAGIAERFGQTVAQAWFVPAKGDGYDIKAQWMQTESGQIILHTGTAFRRDQIQQRFCRALREIFGNDVKVVR